jgi:hypothetical protein
VTAPDPVGPAPAARRRRPFPEHVRLHPGAVLDLAEADYMYGAGRLALKVEKIGADPAQYRAMEWVFLIGRELHWDGRVGEERYATVRVSAIDDALRPAGWLPT